MKKEVIVAVSGYFDPIHVGHLKYLKLAKNLGAKDMNDLRGLISKQIQNQYKMNLDVLTKENILKQIEKGNKM